MNRVVAILGGGMGNRFPGLCSAMRIAAFYGRDLYVDWHPQAEIPITLSDLFEGDLPFHLGRPDNYVRSDEAYPRDENTVIIKPPQVDGRSDKDITIVGFDYYGHHLDHRTLTCERCNDPFMFELGDYFKSLPLAPAVRKRLEDFDRRLDYPGTLGVHVRRTVKNSIYSEMDSGRGLITLSAYVRAIEVELERNPQLKSVYISTNDEEARLFLQARFGPMAITNENAGCGWHTVDELREAFVEMLVLSRCARILRQQWTSFSHFASVINLTPVSEITFISEPVLERWDWHTGLDTEKSVRLSRPTHCTPEGGWSWRMYVGHETLSDDYSKNQSPLRLFEDERPLGPPHALQDVIANQGMGAYLHWQGFLYFSTSDNSSPLTNGRKYTMSV